MNVLAGECPGCVSVYTNLPPTAEPNQVCVLPDQHLPEAAAMSSLIEFNNCSAD